MTIAVHIVATGARTPLGLDGASSAAAYRAKISAVSEHPFMIDRAGNPMQCAFDSQLDSRLMGTPRFLALAETALLETCIALNEMSSRRRLRFPIYVGLPEHRPGFTAEDMEVVRRGLANISGLPIDISELIIFSNGHAAALAALAKAVNDIQQGKLELCLVGGIDSYCHPDTMEWLDENRQLAGAISRSGFVPGEGAGFCLLMNERIREELGFASLARVGAFAISRESKRIKTTDVCLGNGLTAVVQSIVNNLTLPSEKINAVICDINGERYRGEEWGFVCLRLSQYFDDPTAYWSPADCWGDAGAASGPLFAMLACQAAKRGYIKRPRALLWASSEEGLRSAVLLEFDSMDKHTKKEGNYV